MEKNLKNSYKCLDLPFSATEIDVEARKNALVKILEGERNVKTDERILELENAANLIISNIKKNGIPKKEHHLFESSNESIIGLLIVFIFMFFICFFSFYFYA